MTQLRTELEKPKAARTSASEESYSEVVQNVGHLIRRCHQIAVGLFWDEIGAYGITPIQGAILMALKQYPGADQTQLGGFVALDRTNTATTLTRMEQKGLIERRASPSDKRIKLVYPTEKAEALLRSMPPVGSIVSDRLLDGLTPHEKELFVDILKRIVEQKNTHSRAPHQIPEKRCRKSSSAG